MSEGVVMAVDTSALVEKSTQIPPSQQKVLDVLIAAHRCGESALTAGEIRERLEQVYSPRRFDKGWVTGRLDELRDKGAVEQSSETKHNPLTKKSSHLWFVPVRQARLCD